MYHLVAASRTDLADGGGRSQLGDWLPQKRIGSREKCIAFLKTLLQSEVKSPAEWAGLRCLFNRGIGSASMWAAMVHRHASTMAQNGQKCAVNPMATLLIRFIGLRYP